MTYTPPVAEQRFALRHVVGMDELSGHEAFAEATPDLVDAILEGAGLFAAGEFAPLNRVGDEVGAKWSADGVTMPPGFREAYRAYVEGGWGSLAGPPGQGGQGLPLVLATVVMEDLGSANMAFSLVTMLSAGAVEALRHHGSPEMQAQWLPKLVSGEWTGTMNLTEPQAGSDVGALKSRAEPVGDGSWRVTGQKIFITFGDHDLADNIVHLVLARTPGAPPGTKGISLFLVPKVLPDGSPNDLRCVSIEHKLGIHASPTCVMAFGDHGDCRGWLIGGEMGGMRAMFTMMNNARLNVGLQGVSIGERATQAAVAYARQRVQGLRDGRPAAIADHPDVRRMLLRMTALTQAARALCYYAAGQTDRGTLGDNGAQARADLLTPLVKAYGTDIAALPGYPDRSDLRGDERNPGRRPGRPEARPRGRRDPSAAARGGPGRGGWATEQVVGCGRECGRKADHDGLPGPAGGVLSVPHPPLHPRLRVADEAAAGGGGK
jgi:alkylation response protein AidB-like acyl-CoA dehydrogenase